MSVISHLFLISIRQELIVTCRDDLVAIASDKFGTHVLCKAVAVKELEVSPAVYFQKLTGEGLYRGGADQSWHF